MLVIPADLAAVLALVVLTNLLVFRPVVDGPIVRAIVGLVFVLFVPGYAVVAALFPAAGRSVTAEGAGTGGGAFRRATPIPREGASRGIDGIERVALAFGLSIALVPLLVMGLSMSPYALGLVPIVLGISAVAVGGAVIAIGRRWTVPADRRFRVPYWRWITSGKDAVVDADSRVNAALNVSLAVAVLLAVGALAVGIAAPQDAERFTEFYVLTEDDGGDLVAANYSESLTPGVPEPLHLGVENYEQEPMAYTVVVQLQRVDRSATESTVTDRVEVDRFSLSMAHNETTITERELTVSDELTGEDLRLTFLLYDRAVPDTPTRDNAYQSLHLWVDVGAEAP